MINKSNPFQVLIFKLKSNKFGKVWKIHWCWEIKNQLILTNLSWTKVLFHWVLIWNLSEQIKIETQILCLLWCKLAQFNLILILNQSWKLKKKRKKTWALMNLNQKLLSKRRSILESKFEGEMTITIKFENRSWKLAQEVKLQITIWALHQKVWLLKIFLTLKDSLKSQKKIG